MNKKKVGTLFGRSIVTGEIASLKRNEIFCNVSDDNMYSLSQFNEKGELLASISKNTSLLDSDSTYCYIPTELYKSFLVEFNNLMANANYNDLYDNLGTISKNIFGKYSIYSQNINVGGGMELPGIYFIIQMFQVLRAGSKVNQNIEKNYTMDFSVNNIDYITYPIDFFIDSKDILSVSISAYTKALVRDLEYYEDPLTGSYTLREQTYKFLSTLDISNKNIFDVFGQIMIKQFDVSQSTDAGLLNMIKYIFSPIFYKQLYYIIPITEYNNFMSKPLPEVPVYNEPIFSIDNSGLPPVSERPWYPEKTLIIPEIQNDPEELETVDYGIVIGSTNVTNKNRAHIIDNSVRGKIMYDNTTNTLYLQNASAFMIDTKGMAAPNNLTILVIGECSLTCCLYTNYQTTTITGPGILNVGYVEVKQGLTDAPAKLVINNANVSINAQNQTYNWGVYGLGGNEVLELKHSILTVGAVQCCIGDFKNIILNDCTKITPTGVHMQNGYAVDSNGNTYFGGYQSGREVLVISYK